MFELQAVWGWQIALYLFLGGLAGGTFISAAVIHFGLLKHVQAKPRILCISSWVAALCLGFGLLLLLADLTQPTRGLMLWQSFSNTTSWMMIGAWIVFVALIVFGITAIVLTFQLYKASKAGATTGAEVEPVAAEARTDMTGEAGAAKGQGLLNALFGIGAVLGLCVAVYTGILLMSAEGIPFWGTVLLPCLFTVSALGTGIALVEIVIACCVRGEDGEKRQANRYFKVFVVILAVAEAIVLAAYLVTMAGGAETSASVDVLVSGELSGVFWGLVVVCALIVPIVAALIGLFLKGKIGEVIGLLGALSALVGGCALRFCVLGAGAHIDVVVANITNMIS